MINTIKQKNGNLNIIVQKKTGFFRLENGKQKYVNSIISDLFLVAFECFT